METKKTIISWGYKIVLDICLKDKENKKVSPYTETFLRPVFSVSASVYSKGREYMWGQCLKEIDDILRENWDISKERIDIRYFWEKYHLNDMHAWTRKQEERLNKNWIDNRANDYTNVCKKLEDAGLLFDNWIKFWSTWQYWEIPSKDLKDIKKLF